MIKVALHQYSTGLHARRRHPSCILMGRSHSPSIVLILNSAVHHYARVDACFCLNERWMSKIE